MATQLINYKWLKVCNFLPSLCLLNSPFLKHVLKDLYWIIKIYTFSSLKEQNSNKAEILRINVLFWSCLPYNHTDHPTHLPHQQLFLVSNERYGKNKIFLLLWYGIDFAPIKRYRQFCSQAYMFYLNSNYNLCLFVYNCHILLYQETCMLDIIVTSSFLSFVLMTPKTCENHR